MNINRKNEANYSVLQLDGDVDLSCSPEARKHILDMLNAEKNLLVDLSAVTYIDSSGIASLVEGYQTAKKKELDFGLLMVSDAVMNVLKLARLDKVFALYGAIEDYTAKLDLFN